MGFAHATLKEFGGNLAIFTSGYELNINPMLEVVMLANFRRFRLPARPKLVYENHKMRITHGNRNAADFSEG